MNYDKPVPHYGDLMSVDEFKRAVRDVGLFCNDDGVGFPVRDGKMAKEAVDCTKLNEIPGDAVQVIWFNK